MTTQQLSIHNNRLISINTDKVYSNGTSTMLKTLDGKYISRKVINNKDNKLAWRHIFSLLPEELIQIICEDIYRHKWRSICPQIPIRSKYIIRTSNTALQFTCKAITKKGKVCGCSAYSGINCDNLGVFIPSIIRLCHKGTWDGTQTTYNGIMVCGRHRKVSDKDPIKFSNEYIRQHGYSVRNGYPVKINKGRLDKYRVEGENPRYYCGE